MIFFKLNKNWLRIDWINFSSLVFSFVADCGYNQNCQNQLCCDESPSKWSQKRIKMFAGIRFFDTQILSNNKTKLDCEQNAIYLNWFQFNKKRLIKCERNITMNWYIVFLFEFPYFYTPIYRICSNCSSKNCIAYPQLLKTRCHIEPLNLFL